MVRPPRPTPAQSTNSIADELRVAGDRARIIELERLYHAFMKEHFPGGSDPRELKHGFAFRLSTALGRTVADALRADFPGVLPDPDGKGGESAAPVHSGFKKLDVNYSTQQLGLALGVSIKTLNFPDPASRRFTKNATRIDNELRAEAQDYHGRQPYCVMVAFVFVPEAATRDPGRKNKTSFRHIYEVLSKRSARTGPTDPADRFELMFLVTYNEEESAESFGSLRITHIGRVQDAANEPENIVTFDEAIREIAATFLLRNPHHRLSR